MRRHTFTTSVAFGGDTPTTEFDDVTVSYTCTPAGGPGGGSRWEPPTDPGFGPEIDDVRIESIDGTPWASYPLLVDWKEARDYTHDRIVEKILDYHEGDMIAVADEAAAGDVDARREARRDDLGR